MKNEFEPIVDIVWGCLDDKIILGISHPEQCNYADNEIAIMENVYHQMIIRIEYMISDIVMDVIEYNEQEYA